MIHDTWITLFYSAGATPHAAKLAATYAPLVCCARAGRNIKVLPDGRFLVHGVWPSVRACDLPGIIEWAGRQG